MVINMVDKSSAYVQTEPSAFVTKDVSSPHDPCLDMDGAQGNLTPGSITDSMPQAWIGQQTQYRSKRAPFNPMENQSSWRPTPGPWGWLPPPATVPPAPPAPPAPVPAPAPATPNVADAEQMANRAFQSASISFQSAYVQSTAATAAFRNGHYLSGLHSGVTTAGSLLQGIGQVLNGFSHSAKASGQSFLSDAFNGAATYFQAVGSPFVGLAGSLGDMNTALTTLADPQKTPNEKRRDLSIAIGSILNAAGSSANAVSALAGNPNALLQKVQTALANSGNILYGLHSSQRNVQGLIAALSPLNQRHVAAYGSGVISSLAALSAGIGGALVQALKESGYSEAAKALGAMVEKVGNVGTMAGNVQTWIDALPQAKR